MNRERLLLIPLVLWGLAMVVPDLVRVAQPLGSFGFYANNDGVIYDVIGPFPNESSSPAWKAGLRVGDRLDLSRLRCRIHDLNSCRNALAALGGLQFVLPGQSLTLEIAARADRAAKQVKLLAEQRPSNVLVRTVIILDQLVASLVIIGAGWLVWTRPSAMTWGFFLYVNWFNSGQAFAYYAILQNWPVVLIAQDIAGCLAQAAGLAGLLIFVIRAPNNRTEPAWRPVERAIPFLTVIFALVLTASYGSLLGYQTEITTEAGIIAGFAVAAAAIIILLVRKQSQKPEDYQRLRWVLWGCLIGLPSFLIAELASETTFFERFTHFTPTDDIIGLVYLLNGVLCLFVFEAVRRERVVSVWIPLRRVTILAFILTVPALFVHHQIQRIEEHLTLPAWAWFALAVVGSFMISLLHDKTVDLADGFFNRWLDRIEHKLDEAVRRARSPADIEQILADEVFHALKLTSAATFRLHGSTLSRDGNGKGWDNCDQALRSDDPIFAPLAEGAPFKMKRSHAAGVDFPEGFARPVLAVPAVNPARCFAVSLYGPHATGTDFDHNERTMLARVARDAAAIYAELESRELREKVASLEKKMKAKVKPAARAATKPT